jgi:hypothetical protein
MRSEGIARSKDQVKPAAAAALLAAAAITLYHGNY